ncbi:MAG: cupredoxin domain-containing protein [Planctomycetaceae bacterium]
MSKRLLILAASAALVTSACGALPTGAVDFGSSTRFITAVMDTLDDVGQGASVAVNPDATAFVSYFGFPAVVPKGQVPPSRPIGSPFLPAVQLSSMDAKGMVTHGAVQQSHPDQTPTGIGVPFGPDMPKTAGTNLDLTPQNVNGTAVALASDGSLHVAWAGPTGVMYAKTTVGGTSTVSEVYNYGVTVNQAGPIGRPGIALDAAGNPWIAFGVNGTTGISIKVATPKGNGWSVVDAATAGTCNGCSQPLPTGIGFVGSTPVVVFGDPKADAVMAATLSGRTWSTSTVEAGASGAGLALTASGDKAYASYYTGTGSVHEATFDGSAWKAGEVSSSFDPQTTSGLDAPTTGVAVDDQGTIYVTWQDKGVQLASGDGATFTPVDTQGPLKGTGPAIAAGKGVVYLAWYDPSEENLNLGALANPSEVLLANPSPAPTISVAPAGNASCGADGKISLDIVAKGIAFDTNCLVAPANKPFTVNFDNQDAGVPHNVAGFTDSSATTVLFRGNVITGPAKDAIKVDALKPGTYYFHCDIHPTTMFGTLAVVAGAK